MCQLAREQADPARHTILPTLADAKQAQAHAKTLADAKQAQSDDWVLAAALGRAWLAGGSIDWPRVHSGPRRRVELPGYPFQRSRHWIDPERAEPTEPTRAVAAAGQEAVRAVRAAVSNSTTSSSVS